MATGANTYGTVARVEDRVGDIAEGRQFTLTTTITKAQVERMLDDVAGFLNSKLRAYDYVVPVSVADDPDEHAWLVSANSSGAAARVLDTFPGEGFDPEDPASPQNRKTSLWAEVTALCKMIENRAFPATASSGSFDVFSGGQANSDGDTKLPLFTRGMTDYPGTRSLTS